MTKRGSIRNKLLLIILATNLTISAIAYAFFLYWFVSSEEKRRVELATTIEQAIAPNLAKLIYTSEINTASEITSQLKSFPKIAAMRLYGKDHKLLYSYNNNSYKRQNDKKKNALDFQKVFIKKDGEVLKIMREAAYKGLDIGYIELDFKISDVFEIIKEDLLLILGFFFFLFILSYFMASYFAKRFTKPILKLVKFLSHIDLQKIEDTSISTEEKNEFALLYEEVNDLLEKIAFSNELQRIAAVAFEIENGLIITDEEFHVLQVNQAYTKITGYTFDDVVNKIPPVLQQMPSEFYAQMQETLKKERYWSKELSYRVKNEKVIYERLSVFSVLDEEQNVIYHVLSIVDISKEKALQDHVDFLQHYDSLTGLLNRSYFLEEFKEYLSRRVSEEYGYIIALNIKDFKVINDVYGRNYGDLLLQQFARRVEEHVEERMIFARTNSDEFVLLLKKMYDSKEIAVDEARLQAEYFLAVTKEPFVVFEQNIHISIYEGLHIFKSTSKSAGKILKEVEQAVNIAKEREENIAFFDKNIQERERLEVDIYSALLEAVKNDEFELYYQLQYTAEGEPYGAEALLRWNHPKKGIVSPALFIPLAERTGLISEIGRWVLREAGKMLCAWQKSPKTKEWQLSVNIGANHFREENFVVQVKDIFEALHAPFEKLKIELTEYILLKDIGAVSMKMNRLKAMGIKISLDDFGTGFSSLQYLQSLPIDQVKIDQTFVMNMFEHKSNIYIIQAVTMLCNALEMEIIAEGVEDKKSFEKLLSLDCKHFQGYYFAKPKPWSVIEKEL